MQFLQIHFPQGVLKKMYFFFITSNILMQYLKK